MTRGSLFSSESTAVSIGSGSTGFKVTNAISTAAASVAAPIPRLRQKARFSHNPVADFVVVNGARALIPASSLASICDHTRAGGSMAGR